MTDVPSDAVALEALKRLYPGWHINRDVFSGYRAEHKSACGQVIHYVCDSTLAGLQHRLMVIEEARGESE